MRSSNALTCLATLGAISSVSAGPFSWLHIRDDASSVTTTESTSTEATPEVDASLTVDGKNASVAELFKYLNGTSSFNATSWLNSTANATHSITFDADADAEAEEEIELELSYLDGEAVLSFVNGTQLCKGEDSCREIVGEELGLTAEEIADSEECAEELEEEEEDCDEEYEEDDEDDEDEDCEDDEWSEDLTSSTEGPATSSPVANNWNVDAPSTTSGSAASTRSNVYHVAVATGGATGSDSVPTSTATSYMYVTSGAPAGATGTPFPSASGVSGNQDGDDSTVTVTQYVTITVDRFIVSVSGAPEAATTILSTSSPAATTPSNGNNVGNQYNAGNGNGSGSSAVAGATSTGASSAVPTGSYDSPDSPDTPDSEDSADDGYGNIEDCEEDEIPEDDEDEEWECEEEEIDGDDETPDFSEYYNVTECQSILALNATDVNTTFAELTAWCANATASAVPSYSETPVVEATPAATDSATESATWTSDVASSTESATESATSTTEWSAEPTSTESVSEGSSQSESTSASTESGEAVTSYVDVYATEYVQPSASVSSTATDATETPADATDSEPLSKRLANGFRRVRRSHVGRNAFV